MQGLAQWPVQEPVQRPVQGPGLVLASGWLQGSGSMQRLLIPQLEQKLEQKLLLRVLVRRSTPEQRAAQARRSRSPEVQRQEPPLADSALEPEWRREPRPLLVLLPVPRRPEQPQELAGQPPRELRARKRVSVLEQPQGGLPSQAAHPPGRARA
jgi:hypothetical protein